jgi:hypothetical protein
MGAITGFAAAPYSKMFAVSDHFASSFACVLAGVAGVFRSAASALGSRDRVTSAVDISLLPVAGTRVTRGVPLKKEVTLLVIGSVSNPTAGGASGEERDERAGVR